MDVYGIIGRNLGHSFSPAYFKRRFQDLKLNADYLKFELSHIDDFQNLIKSNRNIRGLNITVPYKQSIIPYLDEMDPEAELIGAVNTVKVLRSRNTIKLIGFNTDFAGFKKACRSFLSGRTVRSALILGTGGSSKAVAYALKKMGIQFQFVSRNPKEDQMGYQALDEDVIESHQLIINSTPLGMFPDVGHSPEIPYQFLTNQHHLFDLIYNPEQTLFLSHGSKHGSRIENGLNMLRYQADASWAIWKQT